MKELYSAVGITKINIGPRTWSFSHNFCDKTTWFGDAIRVVNENVGTGNGATTVFNLDFTNIIDVVHGKITDEDDLVPTATQGGTSYKLIVRVDGVQKTERVFGEASGGDYTVNYVTGAITFFTAPANTLVVTADYFYGSNSTVYIKPNSGKKQVITMAECLFSKDIILNDNLITAVYTYDPNQGAPPAKFEYPGSRTRYKRMWDFISFTNGSFPFIPAMGGGTRGFTQEVYQLRFDYISAIELPGSAGAELRIWLENHTVFTGEIGAITFYSYEQTE
jgi:hypothetical protein